MYPYLKQNFGWQFPGNDLTEDTLGIVTSGGTHESVGGHSEGKLGCL